MEKKYLGIFAFAMIAILAAGAVSAFGNLGNKMSEEDREALEAVIKSGDYSAWKSLMESKISEERFEEIRARHQERAEFRALMQEARESGDYSRVQKLKEEFGSGKGMYGKNMNSGECLLAKE